MKLIKMTKREAVKRQPKIRGGDLGYFNSIGATSLSVGSVKVNSVNLARIAYESVSETKVGARNEDNVVTSYINMLEGTYIEKLKEQVRLNMICLDVIRDIIIANKKKRGLLPNISDGLIDLGHMYNTVGVIGVYETLKCFQNRIDNIKEAFGLTTDTFDYIRYNTFGNIYYTERADKFVERLFKEGVHQTIDEVREEFQFDYKVNCEQIPGETAARKLMEKDKLLFSTLVVEDLPLYSNQFIPLGVQATLEERVRVAALFDSFLNGGSICHLNYESVFGKEKAWELLNWVAQQGLTYFAFTTKINTCSSNHAFFEAVCPICGQKAITSYSRIVGFYTPTGFDATGKDTGVGSWSSARKTEFKMRTWEKI